MSNPFLSEIFKRGTLLICLQHRNIPANNKRRECFIHKWFISFMEDIASKKQAYDSEESAFAQHGNINCFT